MTVVENVRAAGRKPRIAVSRDLSHHINTSEYAKLLTTVPTPFTSGSDFKGLYDPRFGGYATCITVCADFAFKIPDSIPSEVAGPLLCAGITTFAPLK